MANIVVSEENKSHIITRATERIFNFKRVTQDKAKESAENHLKEIIKVLEEQVPDDWLFTTNLVAKFIIVFQTPDKIEYRILGRSYRDDDENSGKKMIDELSENDANEKAIENYLQRYIDLLSNPNCKILHELKTIYDKGAHISDKFRIYEAIVREIPYTVPIPSRRLSSRPNALITEKKEILVRQAEILKLDAINQSDYKEYLYFEKLTKEGLDKSHIFIYEFDKQGNLKFNRDVKIGNANQISSINKLLPQDEGYRSQIYWTIPTYPDAVYLDLLYQKENFPECFCSSVKDLRLFFRLECIFRKACQKLGLITLQK